MSELVIVILVLLVMAYPYLMVLRLLRLACKALKKYLSEQPVYADYRDDED